MSEVAQICVAIETLRKELEELVVRGLRAAGPDDLRALENLRAGFDNVGAKHLAARLAVLLTAVKAGDHSAPEAHLLTLTSLRVFERVLTLDAVGEMLAAAQASESDGEEEQRAAAPTPHLSAFLPSAPPVIDAKMLPILEELENATEELLATGLTTASQATRTKLDVSFKEASRLKLLRLAASLRYANEELGRFLQEATNFSPRRLAFFLMRSWLLARGMSKAIRANDTATLARLLLSPNPAAFPSLEVIALGVAKRVAGGSCSFEFRLRLVADAKGKTRTLSAGTPLVWSCLFAHKEGVPPEAYLHLPQPQRFMPRAFLQGASCVINDVAVSVDDHGTGRLLLGPKSTVTASSSAFDDWKRFEQPWDLGAAAERIKGHRPSPLDLEVEMAEEVILPEWDIGDPGAPTEGSDFVVFPVNSGGLSLDAIASLGEEGKELREALDSLKGAKQRPPLLGLVHYELGRLKLRPIALFDLAAPPTDEPAPESAGKKAKKKKETKKKEKKKGSSWTPSGLRQLMISNEDINLQALMGTLKF
jgi:hypothetical protein